MSREVTVNVGQGRMSIFIADPAGAGPHPAVVVIHHRDGVDEFTKATCERLAKNGFAGIAPNLYHRRPAGEDGGVSRRSLTDVEVVADIDAAVAALQSDKAIGGQKLAIIGHCMGGRMSYLGAASNPAFKAAGVFYGGGIFRAEGEGTPPPFDLTGKIKCPVLGGFGREDKNPPPEDVAKISAELTKYGVRHDFKIYDGTGHAYQNFTSKESYREAASEDSWSRLIPFLKAELK
jgi:carboxymethylenebutenolidase